MTDSGADAPGLGPHALGMALRRAQASYRRQMDERLAAAGFAGRRFPEGRVLRMCAGPGVTTISDIGRGLGITRQGASKVVAGLREQGFVAVTPSADDGREKILTLTPRAVEYLLAMYQAGGEIEKRVRDEIGDEAMEQLFRVLDVIADGEPGPAGGPERPDARRAAVAAAPGRGPRTGLNLSPSG